MYCTKFGLSFNAKKFKIMVFSKDLIAYEDLKPVLLNGGIINYVNSIKYLGTTIANNKGFTFSATDDLSSFYRASNSILRAAKKPSDEVLLQLLYSNCIPILTYGCAVKEYSGRQMQDCNTAVNDALRFIFGYNQWESIRTLRESFGYKSLTDLFANAKKKFHENVRSHLNSIISRIASHVLSI